MESSARPQRTEAIGRDQSGVYWPLSPSLLTVTLFAHPLSPLWLEGSEKVLIKLVYVLFYVNKL